MRGARPDRQCFSILLRQGGLEEAGLALLEVADGGRDKDVVGQVGAAILRDHQDPGVFALIPQNFANGRIHPDLSIWNGFLREDQRKVDKHKSYECFKFISNKFNKPEKTHRCMCVLIESLTARW